MQQYFNPEKICEKYGYLSENCHILVFQEKTASELIQCPSGESNPFQPTCPIEEGPLRRQLPLTDEEQDLDVNNFDEVKNRGLPNSYNPVDGWWLDRQQEILDSLNFARFNQLSYEITIDGPVQNSTTKLEALTILQAEQENLVSGISRPDMVNVFK